LPNAALNGNFLLENSWIAEVVFPQRENPHDKIVKVLGGSELLNLIIFFFSFGNAVIA